MNNIKASKTSQCSSAARDKQATDLRTAIEQALGPGEPVAWAYQWKKGKDRSWTVTTARWPESDDWHEYPLFTAPQPQRNGKVASIGLEWTPCMKLPVVVHVRQQQQGEEHVSTREGITPVRPDDLIMRGVSGEEYPIGRAIFEQTYTLDVDTAPQPQRKPLFGDLIAQHPGLSEELAEMQAPKQEPVARYLGEGNEGSLVQLYDDLKKGADLYTAPQPQREWVGLTDEDVRELDTSEFWDDHTPADFVRLVENKLREKNGGGV